MLLMSGYCNMLTDIPFPALSGSMSPGNQIHPVFTLPSSMEVFHLQAASSARLGELCEEGCWYWNHQRPRCWALKLGT